MVILAVNPGSTSTKLALFEGMNETASTALSHSAEDLAPFEGAADQLPMRLTAVRTFLKHNLKDRSLAAVVGRGGLLHPVESGTYAVNDRMKADLSSAVYGEHASNLGGLIAAAIAEPLGIPAFIADPVVVDELAPEARMSGLPELPRKSIFHALNQKSAAREACTRHGLTYARASLIVAHMGGGVSVGAHLNGRVIDVNNALDGEGPFSPERAGTVPAGQLLSLAFSGEHDERALRRMLTGRGGLVAYCGTNSLQDLRRRSDAGEERARLATGAMEYQIAREIASYGATLRGRVDLIILTGGMAHDDRLVRNVRDRVSFLAPVEVIPGEREMLGLAQAAARALNGEQKIRRYT